MRTVLIVVSKKENVWSYEEMELIVVRKRENKWNYNERVNII